MKDNHSRGLPTKKLASPTKTSTSSPKSSNSSTTSDPSNITSEPLFNDCMITCKDIATVYYEELNKADSPQMFTHCVQFVDSDQLIYTIQSQLRDVQNRYDYERTTITQLNYNRFLNMFARKYHPIITIYDSQAITNPFHISVIDGDVDSVIVLNQDVMLLSMACKTPEDKELILEYIRIWAMYTHAYVRWVYSLGDTYTSRTNRLMELEELDEKHAQEIRDRNRRRRYMSAPTDRSEACSDRHEVYLDEVLSSPIFTRVSNLFPHNISVRQFMDIGIKVEELLRESEWLKGKDYVIKWEQDGTAHVEDRQKPSSPFLPGEKPLF